MSHCLRRSMRSFISWPIAISILINEIIAVPCNLTIDCESILNTKGVSICEDGYCTNPFQYGCLHTMEEKHKKGKMKNTRFRKALEKIRICNSDDYAMRDQEICRTPDWKNHFQYDEVRIGGSNYGSGALIGWIHQIILTELLEIPSTIEIGNYSSGREGSFYHKYPEIVYVEDGIEADLNVLLASTENGGNCSNSLVPCAHMLPDVSLFDNDFDHETVASEFSLHRICCCLKHV